MTRASLLAVGLLALVVLSVPAVASVAGEPNLEVTVADDRLAPGEEASLELAIQNRGELDRSTSPELEERVLTARGVTVDLDDDGPIDVRTPEQSAGSIRDGDRVTVPFAVVVDEDAEPGTYVLDAEIEYTYLEQYNPSENVVQERTTDRTVEVAVEVTEAARFEVTNVSTDVAVGDSGPVTLNVTNAGSERARSAVVTVASDNPAVTFGEAAEAREFVGDWAPDETRTVEVEAAVAPDAERRNYSLGATVGYDDADGRQAESERLSFGVEPSPEQSFELANVAADLRVGQDGTLRGELVNDGDAPARNVVLAFRSDNPNVNVLEPEYAIGDLDPSERETFEFEVEMSENANQGPRQFTLEPTYRNVAGDRQQGDPLDARATVGEQRDAFEVAGVEATFETGEDGPLVVSVTNNRNETLTDISGKLFASAPLSVDDDEAFVAALDPGETATMTFGIGVGGGALAKTYPVEVDFRYRTADGEARISDTYNVPVQVTRAENDGVSFPLAVGGAALFALLVGGAYLYRQGAGG